MSATASPVLPATLRLGPAHLTVADLDRAVAFYETSLGLRVGRRDATIAELGDGEHAVLVLTEDPQARPAGRHAGLYHVALLYPTREELARAAVRLAESRTPIQGASDHGTHEAIYLADADGNGLELAADRPRDAWPAPGEEFLSGGGPAPLDLPDLLATVAGQAATANVEPGLRVGHVHLHVGGIDEGLAFYRDLVGFEVWFAMDSAAFVSAGGYHHHLGFNTWRGLGVSGPPPHTVGLRHWTIVLEDPAQVEDVRSRLAAGGAPVEAIDGGFATADPWGTALHVLAATDGP